MKLSYSSLKNSRGNVASFLVIGLLVAGVALGVVLSGQKQIFQPKAAEGPKDPLGCRDNPMPSNERPQLPYRWTADCNDTCSVNSDCPTNGSVDADIKTTNWCYGFRNWTENRCLKLDYEELIVGAVLMNGKALRGYEIKNDKGDRVAKWKFHSEERHPDKGFPLFTIGTDLATSRLSGGGGDNKVIITLKPDPGFTCSWKFDNYPDDGLHTGEGASSGIGCSATLTIKTGKHSPGYQNQLEFNLVPNGGNCGTGGACSSSACANCLLRNKPDILAYYAKDGSSQNGMDNTTCSNQAKIIDNWCTSADPSACTSLKSGVCATSCTSTAAEPACTTTPPPSSSPGVSGGAYTVSGTVTGEGKPIQGVAVEIYNDNKKDTKISITNTQGIFSVEGFVNKGDAYAVRIPQRGIPSSYQYPPRTSTRGWTWRFAGGAGVTGTDTPVGMQTYEFQLAGSNDCAGPDKDGAKGRCNFELTPAGVKCTPGEWSGNLCSKCLSDGRWNINGSDWGDNKANHAGWCSCAKQYNSEKNIYPKSEIDRTCSDIDSRTPTPTVAVDPKSCTSNSDCEDDSTCYVSNTSNTSGVCRPICAGFGGIECPIGYSCLVSDDFPDAPGVCIPDPVFSPTPTPTVSGVCTSGKRDQATCSRCQSNGQWSAPGSDWSNFDGPTGNWCDCAKRYGSTKYFFCAL